MKPIDVSVEPSEEIREYHRMVAENAPDVLSENETFKDVFEYILYLFRQYKRDVLKRVRTEDNGTDPGSDGFCKNPGLP